MFVKGAPENILKRCKFIDVGGQPVPLNNEWEQKFQQANKSFGSNGERVLGFAKLHLPKSKYPKGYKFNITRDNVL